MKTVWAAISLLLLLASLAAADDKTIPASELTSSLSVKRDLGCSWDRDVMSVKAWGYYGSDSKLSLELLTPQKLAAGRKLTLVFATGDMALAGEALVYVRLVYQTTTPKC